MSRLKAELLALLDDPEIQGKLKAVIGVRRVTAEELIQDIREDNEHWRLKDLLADSR